MFASSSEAFLVVLLSLQVLTLDLRAPQRLSLFKAIKKGSRNVVLQSSTFPSEPVNGVVICHATNRFTWLLDTTRQGTKAHILTDFELVMLSLRRERKEWSKYTRTCHTWRSHARHFRVRVYFLGLFISRRKERLLEIQKKLLYSKMPS